jgi:hypothetical protein
MYNFKTNKNKKLFLTRNSTFSYEEKVDVVLSPELYWVRIFDIPIPNKKEALSVVPTFFEDFLDIEDYKFYAVKQEDNKYLCFAYDESKVIDAIENANLSLNQVSSIYFAQNELVNLKLTKLENEYFGYQDDILIKFPKSFINEDDFKEFDICETNLSKYHISINYTSKYIDNKSLYLISAIILLISILNFSKVYTLNNTIDGIVSKQIQIKKDFKIPSTMIQTKSIMRTLNIKGTKQIKLRDALDYLFNFSSSTKGKIQRVDYRNDNLIIYFKEISMVGIKSYLGKKYKVFKSSDKNSVVTIGIKL